MGLIARYSEATPGKKTLTREELINLLATTSNLMDERDEIIAYIIRQRPKRTSNA